MTLEKITLENLNDAIAAAREIFPYETHADGFWPEKAYREAIEKQWENFAYYLAKTGGEIVGITGHYPPEDGSPEMWLGWFGVRPAFRGIGHGARMLRETLGMVASAGQAELRLYSGDREEERAAHRLYVREGFVAIGRGEVDGAPVIYFCGPARAQPLAEVENAQGQPRPTESL